MTGPYIAVVGGGHVDEDLVTFARHVGRGIAQAGGVLICGGLGDILSAAIDGARQAGGTTVALLPGLDRHGLAAEPTVTVPTGLGEGRKVLIARCCDAMIAIGGGYGTLSEIALAARTGTSIVGYRTWQLQPPGTEDRENPIIPATPPTTPWPWRSRCHRPEHSKRPGPARPMWSPIELTSDLAHQSPYAPRPHPLPTRR